MDLGIPDDADMTHAAGRRVFEFLTSAGRPDLVIADEVVWALPICKDALDVPCVLITDWFFSQWGRPRANALLNKATAIVVPDFRDAHEELPHITVPVHFTGPLVNRFGNDGSSARHDLGVPPDAFMAVVTLGGMTDRPEARQIAALALESWRTHAGPRDRLFVLAGPDAGDPSPHGGVTWVGVTQDPEPYFSAADVVVADAAGFTVCELSRSDIAVVTVEAGVLNDATRRRLRLLADAGATTGVTVRASPDDLWRHMRAARAPRPAGDEPVWATADDVAARILAYLGGT
ncbi:hypothetical protein [Nonomuraea sp. NPDC049607]|uniref:hypothetical protein n=1 Tax=Nonomuraea sp. NPDC049607 TaxID=3154732 RepID=UPI003439EA66